MKKMISMFFVSALALTASASGQTEHAGTTITKSAEQISEVRDEFPQYSVECWRERCSPEEHPKYTIDGTEQKNRIVSLFNEAVNESTEIELDPDYGMVQGGNMLMLSLAKEDGTIITVQLQSDKNYDEEKLQRGNILCWVFNANQEPKQENVRYSAYRCGSEIYNELYSELENIMDSET